MSLDDFGNIAADPRLSARVVDRMPLRYDHGSASHLDRAGHVRAASGLVATAGGLVIVQDDTLFLASVGPDGVQGVPLPAPHGVRRFEEARHNKGLKPDFEAVCAWPRPGSPWIVGFGSGSKANRERLVVAHADDLAGASIVDASPLYRALRRWLPRDAELNVEAAFPMDGRLRLLQRGNGRGAVDAWFDVAGGWMDDVVRGQVGEPELISGGRVSLGELGRVRLTWTDGAAIGGGRFVFSATAEASPDAIGDGAVRGSAIGWVGPEGGAWGGLVDPDGRLSSDKLEGIAVRGPFGPGAEVWGVVDADDPEAPSELLRISLLGPWPSSPG